MTNLNRSSVKIGDVSCDVFTDGEGYFYSQTSLASLVNKSHKSVGQFLNSKWLKDNQGEGCSVGYFPEFIENQSGIPYHNGRGNFLGFRC